VLSGFEGCGQVYDPTTEEFCFHCNQVSNSNTGVCAGNPPPGTLMGYSYYRYYYNFPFSSPAVSTNRGPSEGSSGSCGSIIENDPQVLGEAVSLVGTPWSLNYYTDRVSGRSLDYTIVIPLTGDSIPSNVTGNTVTLSYLGRTSSYTISNLTPNQSFTWTWDGKDNSGNPILGSTSVQIKVGTTYNDGSIDYPVSSNAQAGNYQAILAGLGGWSISTHHFYDVNRTIIYFGDGTSRSVTAQLINGNTQYMAANSDGSEIYIFDLNGKHLYTLSLPRFSGHEMVV